MHDAHKRKVFEREFFVFFVFLLNFKLIRKEENSNKKKRQFQILVNKLLEVSKMFVGIIHHQQ
jgi:hypothetical protein